MKYYLLLICFFAITISNAQENRLLQLEVLISQKAATIKGLRQTAKLDLNSTDLATLFAAVATSHDLNITIDPALRGLNIENTFNEVLVSDLFLFLAKEYSLDYTFLGDIITVKQFKPPVVVVIEDRSDILYDGTRNFITLDLNNAPLDKVFRNITDKTGKNLLYDKNIEKKNLSIYVKDVPLKKGLEQLALSNDLLFQESRDGFYLFANAVVSSGNAPNNASNQNTISERPRMRSGNNFDYEVLDTVNQLLRVNFKNAPVEDVVLSIANDLKLGIYVAAPLNMAGTASITSNPISFESLLDILFQSLDTKVAQAGNVSQNGSNNNNGGVVTNKLTYKREGNLYFFGSENQLSLQTDQLVPLKYRSIQLLSDNDNQVFNRTGNQYAGFNNSGFNNTNGLNNNGFQNSNSFSGNLNNRNNGQQPGGANNQSLAQVIKDLLPDDIINSLDIKIDNELNSFIVSGPGLKVKRFKELIQSIDKPVPVILIETMILEVNKNYTLETGIEWGLGDAPVQDRGSIYPTTELTLGSTTVNRVIGGLNGFSSLNIGQVVPNFYVNLKAMESNGDIAIKSTPKLSVLNGHQARLSIGQTTYYVVTSRDIIGTDNPLTNTIINYQPIDAELGIYIKPIVSTSGDITMSIVVNQSTFSPVRIAPDAPPDINSRQFTSTIRVKDQDVIILGGLEENIKNDSGSGVPFLARIPIIKYLFSKRVRERNKRKLAILIRPTVIY